MDKLNQTPSKPPKPWARASWYAHCQETPQRPPQRHRGDSGNVHNATLDSVWYDKSMTTTAEHWVNVQEAMALTGKSERTIRRYAAIGQLPSKKERGRLYVNLAGEVPGIAQPQAGGDADTLAELQATQAELERGRQLGKVRLAELQAHIDTLTARCGEFEIENAVLRARLTHLAEENSHLWETVKLLPAPERHWWQFWK